MPNTIFDNTYYVDTVSGNALQWSSGSTVNNVIFWAVDTTAAAHFVINGTTSVIRFSLLTHGAVSVGSAASVTPMTFVVDMGKTRFPTAWIPTIMTACTAWINFA